MRTLDILVVDDNLYSLEVTLAVLKSEGHRVTACDTRADALPRLRRQRARFDAVVVAEALPADRLREVLAALQPAGPRHLPMIVLTETKGRSADSLVRRLGADAYVRTPYRRRELLQTLEATVGTAVRKVPARRHFIHAV
jgi:CheY-like chemotaxis protein